MPLPCIQPIIPTWRKAPFDDPDWLFDLKYDGFRGLCYIEPGRSRLISRNGHTFDRFAALAEQIAAALDVHDAILDGEVIAADETGRPQFYGIVAKSLVDPYDTRVRWLKIKNRAYTQAEGRGDLFNGPRRPMQSAGWR